MLPISDVDKLAQILLEGLRQQKEPYISLDDDDLEHVLIDGTVDLRELAAVIISAAERP